VQCAQAIANEADGFAVACLEEAIELRQAGIRKPILLLEGFFEAAELPEIVANDCWIVLHAQWQIDIFLAAKLAKPLHIWLKMDSGMHRVGLAPASYQQAFNSLVGHANTANIVLMSHFANADNLKSIHTKQQISVFQQAVQTLNFDEVSLANSAAILGWPQSYNHWSRPGIMLYGADPLAANAVNQLAKRAISEHPQSLRAVMQLSSKIISIRSIQKGESIGYGSIFTADKDTIVGVVACGYADGYPRSATGATVAVDGNTTRIIGRVSMDMLFVDLTDITKVNIGSDVELWGDQVSANDVANVAGTIAYELFCNVKRVQFSYTDKY
jgi:alanine racemase